MLKKDLSSDRLYNGQEKHFSRMLNGFTGPCLYLNPFFFFFFFFFFYQVESVRLGNCSSLYHGHHTWGNWPECLTTHQPNNHTHNEGAAHRQRYQIHEDTHTSHDEWEIKQGLIGCAREKRSFQCFYLYLIKMGSLNMFYLHYTIQTCGVSKKYSIEK